MTVEEERPSRMRRLLWITGAVVYGVGALVLLSIWRMPVDSVLRSVETMVLTRSGHTVQFGHGSVGWTGGLRIESVDAEIRTPGASIPVEVDAIEIQPQWISTMLGRVGARVDASVYGGSLELWARAARWDPGRLSQATARLTDLDLSVVTALQSLLGGRVQGVAQLAAELAVEGPEPNQWHGRAGLQVTNLDMQNVALGGLTVERLPLGRVDIELEIPDGVGEAQIRRCEIGGAEVELTATGRVVLAPDPARCRLEVQARLRLSGQTRETLGEALSLMGFAADEQGWTQIALSGTLLQPRANAARLGGATGP
jgi:type II secretion system protein N